MTVTIVYTNHRGETAARRITPERIWFGATELHPEEQWLLDAIDEDRPGRYCRTLAMKGIRSWGEGER